jgi:cytosine/creatinine deaminase
VPFDFILANARLPITNQPSATVDIGVSDGRIAAIEPRLSAEGTRVDVQGKLVSPGLVESHFHLDKIT